MTISRTIRRILAVFGVLAVVLTPVWHGQSSLAAVEAAVSGATGPTTTKVTSGLMAGVDLSSHQGESALTAVNFAALAQDRQRFALIRAGSSEGCPQRTSIVQRGDELYPGFVSGARANGLRVGHYWMNGNGNPVVDATFFVNHLSNYSPGDPLVLDVEPHYQWIWDTETQKFQCKRGDFWTPAVVLQWVNTVKALVPHANVYVYMNRRTLDRHDWSAVAPRTRLWFAAYGHNDGTPAQQRPTVKYWTTWSIWQYTNAGRIKGILRSDDSPIDRNLARHDAWTPIQ